MAEVTYYVALPFVAADDGRHGWMKPRPVDASAAFPLRQKLGPLTADQRPPGFQYNRNEMNCSSPAATNFVQIVRSGKSQKIESVLIRDWGPLRG